MEWLKELGLFRGVAGNAMNLGLCSRSGDVIGDDITLIEGKKLKST